MISPSGGIDPATINPPDAVAALRSFPRRWHSALALVADDPSAGDLVRRRVGDSRSALEHAWYAANLLGSTRDRIQRTRREDVPALEGDGSAGFLSGDDDDLEVALDAIGDRAPALAATLDGLGPHDWERRAIVAGQEVTILAMARQAVADAANHLRGAERALREARSQR